MYVKDGKPFRLPNPSELWVDAQGIQHPGSHFQREDFRVAHGVTWHPDPVRKDDRFYINSDSPDGLSIVSTPRELALCQQMMISDVKRGAYNMLLPTDWMFTRELEDGIPVPDAVKLRRAAIKACAASAELAIMAATTVEELQALQISWPSQ